MWCACLGAHTEPKPNLGATQVSALDCQTAALYLLRLCLLKHHHQPIQVRDPRKPEALALMAEDRPRVISTCSCQQSSISVFFIFVLLRFHCGALSLLARAQYVVQADLELPEIQLPLPPKCQDQCMPPFQYPNTPVFLLFHHLF